MPNSCSFNANFHRNWRHDSDMADLVTIALSAGIGAGVSALGVIDAQVLQRQSQRKITNDAQAHEERLQRDPDERDMRDGKLDRLRSGLLTVTGAAMTLLDAIQRLAASVWAVTHDERSSTITSFGRPPSLEQIGH